MPVYEYECTSCGESFEKFQSVNSRTPRQCPSCSSRGTLRKQVSAPAFHLKGSGWYVTDYAGKGKEPAKEAEKDSSESSSDDKKASKPDAKEKKSSSKSSGDKDKKTS